MAELAAGALVAEQVVSTSLEAGAAVTLAKPTQPLKATLSQIATTPANDSSLALARSHHTVTVIDNKAYIFGGTHAPNTLCTTDIHALALPTANASADAPSADYACYPAFPLKDTATGTLLVPAPRQDHAACLHGKHLVIHGGHDAHSNPITAGDDHAYLWLFDTTTLRWSRLGPANPSSDPHPGPCAGHTLFSSSANDDHNAPLILLAANETWSFDIATARWTQLPSAPAPSASAALVDGTLYSISAASSSSPLSGALHVLRLGNNSGSGGVDATSPAWETIEFSTNPLAAPGPKARIGGALVPVATGYGRHYLVYLFGRAASSVTTSSDQKTVVASEAHPLCSDVWALQVPSHGFTPAAIKDTIRDKVLPASVESGAYSWAEVEIVPTEQVAAEGKVHPGPRAFVGASACLGGRGVVFWGGENAGGQRESDGWLLNIK